MRIGDITTGINICTLQSFRRKDWAPTGSRNMKFILAVLLFALIAGAFCEKANDQAEISKKVSDQAEITKKFGKASISIRVANFFAGRNSATVI